jgi:cyclopropane fatty-acyl-phospholipid synthase-like methyltransferase
VSVSLIYRIMYLVGFSPWDTGEVPSELSDVAEGPDALPTGQALDIGCGTGTQAVYLAGRGWEVTAIDAVEKPLRRARARASASGASVTWIRGDVTRLAQAGLQPGITLFFDRGCFHGLNERQRASYASGVTELAAPGATLLLMSFAPNKVLVAPTGADESEIRRTFAGWQLVSCTGDTGPNPEGPLKDVSRRWYRLRRPV